jgi:hypothetical protein
VEDEMGKSKEEIIDAEITGEVGDEEIIEMIERSPGRFLPVAVRKRKIRPLRRIPTPQGMDGIDPYVFTPQPMMSMVGQSRMAQFLNGVMIGLDMVDRFMEKVEKMKRGGRR